MGRKQIKSNGLECVTQLSDIIWRLVGALFDIAPTWAEFVLSKIHLNALNVTLDYFYSVKPFLTMARIRS